MTTKLPEPALTITTKLGYMVGGNSTTLRKGDKLYTEEQLAQFVRDAHAALRAIEQACVYSPHRDLNTWDRALAHLIHHHARLLPALEDAA